MKRAYAMCAGCAKAKAGEYPALQEVPLVLPRKLTTGGVLSYTALASGGAVGTIAGNNAVIRDTAGLGS
jgi:hypothetical protein